MSDWNAGHPPVVSFPHSPRVRLEARDGYEPRKVRLCGDAGPPLQHDSARGYATPAMLEFGHMFLDGILDFRGAGHALEFDFRWRLHFVISLVCWNL